MKKIIFILSGLFFILTLSQASSTSVEVTLKVPLELDAIPEGLTFHLGSNEFVTNSEQGIHCLIYTKEDKTGYKFSKFQMVEAGKYTLDVKFDVPIDMVNSLKSYNCYVKYNSVDNRLFVPTDTQYFDISTYNVEGQIY